MTHIRRKSKVPRIISLVLILALLFSLLPMAFAVEPEPEGADDPPVIEETLPEDKESEEDEEEPEEEPATKEELTEEEEEQTTEETPPLFGILGAGSGIAALSADTDKAWYEDAATDGSGNEPGSEENPYLIGTADELAYLAALVNNTAEKGGAVDFSGKFIKLTDNIDLSTFTVSANSGLATNWTPIGTTSQLVFKGTFNGNGHAMTGLKINNTSNYQGLFGRVTSGTIKNLALEDVTIIAGRYSGGIVGYLTTSGCIENSYITGSVKSASGDLGGIVGYVGASSYVRNCYSLAEIESDGARVGGIAGYSQSSTIENCYFMGTVKGTGSVGGIAGSAGGSITNCAALNEEKIGSGGRIFGTSNATVSGSFAWNNMLIKPNDADAGERQTGAENDLNGADKTGTEICQTDTWSAFSSAAWTIEMGKPPILNAFSGNSNIAQIDKYPDYITNGVVIVYPDEQKWYYENSDENNQANTYYISNAAELAFLANLTRRGTYFSGKTVILTADIDLDTSIIASELAKYKMKDNTAAYDGNGWIPIENFQGTFDGDGHVIKNLKIDRPSAGTYDYQGLFARSMYGLIKNLGVIDADVKGYRYVGAIAGQGGNFENCFSTGTVSGESYVGGITGGVIGDVENCYSTADVLVSNALAGGVVGEITANKTVEFVYSAGKLSNNNDKRYITGGVSYINTGYVTIRNAVALNEGMMGAGEGLTRITNISASYVGNTTLSNNYAWDGFKINGSKVTGDNVGHDKINGADMTSDEIYDGAVWDAQHANFPTDVWTIAPGKLPILKIFETKNSTRGVSVQDAELPAHISDTLARIVSVTATGTTSPVLNDTARTFGASVANSVTSQVIDVTTYGGATWDLYSDYQCTTPLANKTMTALSVGGGNKAYIKVTSKDTQTERVYTVTITKAAPPPVVDDGGDYGGGGSSGGGGGSSGGGSSSTTPTTPSTPTVTTPTEPSAPVVATTEVAATVTNNTAAAAVSANTISTALEQAAQESLSAGTSAAPVVVEVKMTDIPASATAAEMTTPSSAIQNIASTENASLSIDAGALGTLTFDNAALNTIAEAATGDITFKTETVDAATLPQEMQDMVGDAPVFDFTVTAGGNEISDFGGGSATITIPYTPPEGSNPDQVVVYLLRDDGTLEAVNGKYDPATGTFTMTLRHFSKYIIKYNPVSYADVYEGDWYKTAVQFTGARGLLDVFTTGNTLNPTMTITRAEFTVMLLKAYGIPVKTSGFTVEQFSDIPADASYANAVRTARELGIVDGVGNNNFSPDGNLNREQFFKMVYFALDAIGNLPKTDSGRRLSDFIDANELSDYAIEPAAALVKAGIIQGVGGGKIGTTSLFTRAEIAVSVYRLLNA